MNVQNQKLEVMKKRCDTTAKVLKVLRTICIAAAIVLFVALFLIVVKRNDIDAGIYQGVEDGSVTITQTHSEFGILRLDMNMDELYDAGHYAIAIAIQTVIGIVMCIISAVIIEMLRGAFVCMCKEDTPFSDAVMKKLRIAFIIMIVCLFLGVGLGAGIIGMLVLWCIYSILEYGAALQTEVDETL